MKLVRYVVSAALLVSAACSSLQAQRVELLIDEGDKVKDPPEKVSLAYNFVPGELRRYDVTVQGDGNVQMPGQKEKARILSYTTMTFLQHVKSLNPTDQTWKIEWDMLKGQMTIPEFGEMWLTVPPLEYQMDKYGAVNQIKGITDLTVSPGMTQGKVLGDILNQLRAIGFPHRTLAVGDQWVDKYTVTVEGQEPVAIDCTSKLVGFEKLHKSDCAKIQTTYTTPFLLNVPPEEPASSDGNEATGVADDKKPMPQLKGEEKVEYWTYFSYNDGKIIQTFGTIELSADIVNAGGDSKAKASEQQAKEAPKPATTDASPAPDLLLPQPKHDLYVKFQMIAKHNPEIPKSVEDIKE